MKELTQEQKNAAYALNLCTVSVSQIIDYNDINVMDQEYEAILNNLNLERFPKDEALLDIIKQILDTITFFKIQNSKKELLEKEYRHRMKNAIWSAVPNLGLIVASGDPVTIAVSLASQVGIGYMNYRKTRSDTDLSKDREILELEWTAMEQLNGLRRELFDTAWRLADKYSYPDELRLTERQIIQYNDILMDVNSLRRFDRFEAVKDNFYAYPPFWYQFGSTANEISRDNTLDLSETTRKEYRGKARDYFEKYWDVNNSPLLREDQLAAACALEYADILIEDKADKNVIADYMHKAIVNSGRSCDVLQMCAITYLRIGRIDDAVLVLRYLLNEDYNTSINAQILSGIYINSYINGSISAKSSYETLRARVSNDGYLIPWPDENGALDERFINSQRSLLEKKYQKVLDALQDKYVISFNRILPPPSSSKEYADSFYTEIQENNRIDLMRSVLAVTEKKEEYLAEISRTDFAFRYIDIFNDLLSAFEGINSITNMAGITEIATEKISSDADKLNQIQLKLQNGEFTLNDYITVQSFTTEKYSDDVFEAAMKQIKDSIYQMSNMEDFSREESLLAVFCENQKLPDPDIILSGPQKTDELVGGDRLFISYGILGDDVEDRARKTDKLRRMKDIIRDKLSSCVITGGQVRLILPEDEQFSRYFNKKDEFIKQYKPDVLAVLDDTNIFSNIDILLTTTGIIYISKDKLQEVRTYESVRYDDPDTGLQIGSKDYKNKNVDLNVLYDALTELNRIVIER